MNSKNRPFVASIFWVTLGVLVGWFVWTEWAAPPLHRVWTELYSPREGLPSGSSSPTTLPAGMPHSVPEALDAFEAVEAFIRTLWQTLAAGIGVFLSWLIALCPLLFVCGHGRTIELLHRNLHVEEQKPRVLPRVPQSLREEAQRRGGMRARWYDWILGAIRYGIDFAYGLFRNLKWFQGLLSTRTLGRFVFVLFKPLPAWPSSAETVRPDSKWKAIGGLGWFAAVVAVSLYGSQWRASLRVLVAVSLFAVGIWLFWCLIRFLAYCLAPLFRPQLIFHRAQVYVELSHLLSDRIEPDVLEEEYSCRVGELQKNLHQSSAACVVTPIKCGTLFDVFDKKDEIRRYFETQEDLPPVGWKGWIQFVLNSVICLRADHRGTPTDATFLCPLTIESGFLCPTYLVSGLLAEFDEDWARIVRSYRRDAGLLEGDPLKPYPGLRKLQVFIWDCWIQWGPSVPICASANWKDGVIGLQYGYGDENNSLPLIYAEAKMWDDLKRKYASWQSASNANWPFVIPARVQAELKWIPPELVLNNGTPGSRTFFCTAQRRTMPPHPISGATQGTDGHQTVQEYEAERLKKCRLTLNATKIEPERDHSQLYSAYVWVMIAICKTRKSICSSSSGHDSSVGDAAITTADSPVQTDTATYELLHPHSPNDRSECWKGLIPFFQHGNIAEESVYRDIKEELATKSIDSLMRFLEENDSPEFDIEFAYVCAFDDNGDGGAAMSSEPLPGHVLNGETIRELMEVDLIRYVARKKTGNALDPLKRRIHLAANAIDIKACDLPMIVQQFLHATSQIPDAAAMRIVNLREAELSRSVSTGVLTKAYNGLYLTSFPSENEREPLSQYQERVIQKSGDDPETHFVVAGLDLADGDACELGGFLIVEWYQKSKCGLLTYLAVANEARRQNLATRLVSRGLKILRECNGGQPPRAVFAEARHPDKRQPDDSMDPAIRLHVLGQLGASLVPLEGYVQPKLQAGKERSQELVFLAFDPSVGERATLVSPPLQIPAEVITEFLAEFYLSLSANDPEDKQNLTKMTDEIERIPQTSAEELADRFGRFGLPVVTVTSPSNPDGESSA